MKHTIAELRAALKKGAGIRQRAVEATQAEVNRLPRSADGYRIVRVGRQAFRLWGAGIPGWGASGHELLADYCTIGSDGRTYLPCVDS